MSEHEEVLAILESASIDEPVSGAIECAVDNGPPSERLQKAIRRFIGSKDLDNRYQAMLNLVHDFGCNDLELEAVALTICGLAQDDSDAYFGGVGMLSTMGSRGNERARRLIALLKRDDKTREALQLKPE